jgi:predicted ribosomally synthesized peptide with nif11-like leader
MSHENLDNFRELVLQDLSLQEKLRDIADRTVFLSIVVQLGAQSGYSFTAQEVEAALRASQRAWIERWLDV